MGDNSLGTVKSENGRIVLISKSRGLFILGDGSFGEMSFGAFTGIIRFNPGQ